MSGAFLEKEGRIAARTNMFIAAAMHTEGVSTPVKVRNLSEGGALIETSVAPAAETLFTLQRGGLKVRGTVAWSTNNRCGLRFESTVNVRDWMAPPANLGQVRVDAMVAQLRTSGLSLVPSPSRTEADAEDRSEMLARVAMLIEALGDELAADADTVSRHGAALQNIDRALQLLVKARL